MLEGVCLCLFEGLRIFVHAHPSLSDTCAPHGRKAAHTTPIHVPSEVHVDLCVDACVCTKAFVLLRASLTGHTHTRYVTSL